ncbi:Crp/Fnr family transcriptional regulator [Methylobacterium flocculans]|uniref:Crp/Fnr family transcriptional regulator n=1 Tax=Methylobacterium flocculans TaxID=2984843 RepID=UPI0021F2D1A0|nr:Crp/Fnr family transcriptional regulator [Methylobacterium sp. FF17]
MTQVTSSAVSSSSPFIRKLEAFAVLSDEDRLMLERISTEPYVVDPQTDLVREGDKPDGVYLIMEGMACRHKRLVSGARQIMAYLVPGDLCDLDVALLDQMDHTITTLSDCKVVRLSPKTVADIMEDHPAVARGLRIGTLVDEATLREWLLNVGRRTPIQRLAHLFCELFERLAVVGQVRHDSFSLPLAHTDLADTTGLTKVHVTRSIQELRRQRLIDLTDGDLKILDLPRLREIAGFRANYLHLGDAAAA